MFMYALVREAIAPVPSLDSDIAKRAVEELRYRAAVEESDARTKGNRLRETLQTLDIKPFTPKSVVRYKAAMCRAPLQMWAVVAGLFALGYGCELLRELSWVMQPLDSAVAQKASGTTVSIVVWDLAWFLGAVGRFVAPIIGTIVGAAALFNRWGEWRMTSLADCQMIVPSFALETALRIRTALPGAQLHIDYYVTQEKIQEERRAQRLAADPFLVVQHGDCTEHIEVWDEPSFNQERRA